MATTSDPATIVSDSKVTVMLDDLSTECYDSLEAADRLHRSKAFNALDSSTKSRQKKFSDILRKTVAALDDERYRCADGVAKDTRALKKWVSNSVSALDNLEESNGRMQVLEQTMAHAHVTKLQLLIPLILGENGKLALLQRRLHALQKKLEKAIRACRDAKIKTMIGAALGAIGICLGAIGWPIAVGAALVAVPVGMVVSATFSGNEESTFKKTMSTSLTVGRVVAPLNSMTKSFGPVSQIATTGLNLGSVFANESEKKAVITEIKKLNAEIKKVAPTAAKQYQTLDKLAKECDRQLRRAVSSVKSLRISTSKAGHGVLRLL